MLILLGTPLAAELRDTQHWRCLDASDPAALIAHAREAVENDATLRSAVWVWLLTLPRDRTQRGALQVVDRLRGARESRYPPIHFQTRLPRTTLDVGDATLTAYNALVRLHTAELLVLLATPPDLAPSTRTRALLDATPAFHRLTEAVPPSPPVDLADTLLGGAHATHSQRLQILALCVRYHALHGRWPAPDTGCPNGARGLISALRTELDAVPVHYG
ncbi:MAG: hypothetical protein AAGA11_02940 [Pseudomonadota bacterium]